MTRREKGNAVLEVALLAPVLLVPLMWLVMSVAVVVDARAAVVTAARQAARAYVTAPNSHVAAMQARQVAVIALRMQSQRAGQVRVAVRCNGTCLTPNSRVDVTVSASVALPFVPLPTSLARITVSQTESALVDPYRDPDGS